MRLEWTGLARADLNRIWEFNGGRDVERADRVDEALVERAASLLLAPRKGRPGRVSGTRELSVPDIQYVLIYEVDDDAVRVLRVWSTVEHRDF